VCDQRVTLGANSRHRAGGVPPLGYQARDRKLVIVESKGENRCFFRRYAELGSVRLLKDEISPIIDRQLWDAVQAQLAGNAAAAAFPR
jgi:hypothetical protein